jgi:hypothetical protein
MFLEPCWALRACTMAKISDENQIVIPPSFVALFVEPSRVKPNAPREHILERYELCEDMATMLMDHARTNLWELGVTEADVLERIHRGLVTGDAGVNASEAEWVSRRLAELFGWDYPTPEVSDTSQGRFPG